MIRPIRNWMSRHQNPVNFWLHMLGIPQTIVAVPLAIMGLGLVAAAMFVSGYALQFIGHAIEGNHSGEALLVARLLKAAATDKAAMPMYRRRKRR